MLSCDGRVFSRRVFSLALGSICLTRRASARPSPRLALLLAVPWEGQDWYQNDIDTIRNALRARGLRDSEMTIFLGPLDRQGLQKILADTRRRMAGWKDGNVFVYYDGHGMYRRAGQGAPQAGLQLGKDRTSAGAAMLWREFFAELAPPTGVQTVLLPDCCHTNLLAGRLPPATTAAIMKSAPQDSLSCKTGSWRFEDPRPQRRYGVISYYGGRTLASAHTAADWIQSMQSAAKKDVARAALPAPKRVDLMAEGDPDTPLLGKAASWQSSFERDAPR